uniref:Secreted protein n=1 Tax=Oryzias latipes TaxID=8090 RepID=A0A3P9IBN2_ORYLA
MTARDMKSLWNWGSMTCITCFTWLVSHLSINSSRANSLSGPLHICMEGCREEDILTRIRNELHINSAMITRGSRSTLVYVFFAWFIHDTSVRISRKDHKFSHFFTSDPFSISANLRCGCLSHGLPGIFSLFVLVL